MFSICVEIFTNKVEELLTAVVEDNGGGAEIK